MQVLIHNNTPSSSSSSSNFRRGDDELPPRPDARSLKRQWLTEMGALVAVLLVMLVVGAALGGFEETCEESVDGGTTTVECRHTHPVPAGFAFAGAITAGQTLFFVVIALVLLGESSLQRIEKAAQDQDERRDEIVNGGGAGRRVVAWDCASEDPASWEAFAARYAGTELWFDKVALAVMVPILLAATVVAAALGEVMIAAVYSATLANMLVLFRVPSKACRAWAWRSVPRTIRWFPAPSFTRARMLDSPGLFKVHMLDDGDMVFRGVLAQLLPAATTAATTETTCGLVPPRPRPIVRLEQYTDGDGIPRWNLQHARKHQARFVCFAIVPVPAGRVDEVRGLLAAACDGPAPAAEPVGSSDLIRYDFLLRERVQE